MTCDGENKVGNVLRLGEINQNGIAMQGAIGGNPPGPQFGKRHTSQRKSITFKANNVDKRCGIIQLGPGTDDLTKNIDLAQLCLLPQAPCGQTVVALSQLHVQGVFVELHLKPSLHRADASLSAAVAVADQTLAQHYSNTESTPSPHAHWAVS